MKTLVIQNLKAGYGKKQVLDEVSLCAKAGRITGILGSNGSGKTTLFNALMNFDTWVEGNCFIDGENLLAMKPKRRAKYLALLPQQRIQMVGYRCFDVLMSGYYPHLGAFQEANNEMIEKMLKLCEELKLTQFLERDFTQLSGGQQQMVLLARTLIQDSDAILMDEPDQALDFEHKHEMMRYFRKIILERKKIGIMILHDPYLVLNYCDDVVLMSQGRVIATFEVNQESRGTMEQKMRLLYPKLRLIEYEGNYLPLMGES